ncbi:TonB-dependent receptor [bacterium]|nr:TonB-dependent receptor [bacterium]
MMIRHTPIALAALLLIVSFVSPSHAFAPSPAPLAGQVIDKDTGRPLSGATLLLDEAFRSAVSDAQGMFAFHDLPPDEYSLTARYLGYAAEVRSIRVVEGDALRLLLALRPVAMELDTVRVEAGSAPSSGYRISSAQLHNQTGSDIADVIRAVPGVQVYRAGEDGSRTTVSLRGARPDHVRVQVDGVTLNDGAGEAVDLSSIPLMNVQSIDIDPASHPGAPGGEIRIRTLNGMQQDAPAWSTAIEGRSPGAMQGSASITHRRPNGQKLNLFARYLNSDGDFDYTDESGTTTSRLNNDRERLTLSLSGETRLLGLLVHGSVGGDIQEAGSPAPIYQAPTPEARQTEQAWRAQVRIQKAHASVNPAQLQLFASGRTRSFVSPREQINPATGQTVLHFPSDVEDHDLRGGVRLSKHLSLLDRDRVAVSADLIGDATLERFESVDNLGIAAFSRTGGQIHRATLAQEARLQSRWQLGDYVLRTQLDGRVDQLADAVEELPLPFSGTADTELSGRALLRFAPEIGRWSVDLGTGSAFAPPSFTHRFLVESVFSLGNAALEPERIRDLHAGLNWVQPLHAGLTLSSSLRGYLRETDNLIIWRRNWRGQYFPDNLDRATARGLETAISLSGSGLLNELHSAFTWQRVLNDTPGSPYQDNRIPFQPDWFGNVGVQISPTTQLDLFADLRFTSRRFSSESNLDVYSAANTGLDPYTTLDLAVRWRQPLPQSGLLLLFRAGVDNVSATEYELLERMPMPGRIWHLRVTVQKPR